MGRTSFWLVPALTAFAIACGGSSSGGATFKVSGAISGAARTGVTLTLAPAGAGAAGGSTATSDASGGFSFASVAPGSYTLTPSLAGGYVFTPASLSVTVAAADITGEAFSDAGAFSIAGSVTAGGSALSNVSLTLSGAGSQSVSTDSTGAYSFAGLPNGAYTVTPSLGGYVLSPTSLAVTISGANATGENFTATAVAPTYAISGVVSGLVVSGVTVALSGAASATTTTNSSGAYSFSGLASGSYTVTPSLAGGYTFTPASAPATVSSASLTAINFSDTGSYAISGKVTLSAAGLAGVTLTLSGAGTGATTSASDGTYSLSGLPNGAYTVAASLSGYVFNPASTSATVNGAAVTGKNFAATASSGATYSISGAVSGLVKSGVTITLSGADSGTITTGSDGSYSFSGLLAGSYTVTPSLVGYSFSPSSAPVTVTAANVTGTNFTSTGPYTISGQVSGLLASGVSVALGGAATATTTTDGGGHYSFTGLINGSYTVTPSLSGYSFLPLSHAVTVNGGNQTGENFTDQGAYNITGTITASSVGLAGVAVAATGGPVVIPGATTDGTGSYSLAVPNGTYLVTPSLSGYTFTPTSASVAVSGASLSATNFTASGTTYSISGNISLSTSGPAVGMTVRLFHSATQIALTTTNASGDFSFGGAANGQTYTITPSMADFSILNGASAASTDVTISSANSTGNNFTATAGGGLGLMDFTGTVAYSGAKTGRVLVKVSFSSGGSGANGGTSIAAPGAFGIHGVQVPSGPTTVYVTAWIDTLGYANLNAAADPSVTTSMSFTTGATSLALGTLTLADPALSVQPPRSLQGVIPSDTAAAIIYKGPIDSNGNEAATSYKIYWSTTAGPGPSNTLGTLSIPATNGSFGIVNGLSNGTAYYFGISALIGAGESSVVATSSPTTVGPPTTGHAITGTVSFPDVGGTNTLYVIALSRTGATLVQRIAGPTSPQSYSILVPDGTYLLIAFLDVGNDGILLPTDPGLFQVTDAAGVAVAGAAAAGPDLSLFSTNSSAALATIDDAFNGVGNAQLHLAVTGGLKVPAAVQVTAGPNVLVPVDLGLSYFGQANGVAGYEAFWSTSPYAPLVGDSYTLHVTYEDATSEDLTAAVTAYFANPPALASPANSATGVSATPTFTWAAPSPAPSGTYTYFISVFGNGANWFYGPMSSTQTGCPSACSIAFSTFSSSGPGSSLTASTSYTWRLEVDDSFGNTVSNSAAFQTGP